MVFVFCLVCGVLVFVFGGLGGLGGVMWVCGILLCVCVFGGAIAGSECSFPFFLLVLIAFWRGWVVKCVMFDGRVRGGWIL